MPKRKPSLTDFSPVLSLDGRRVTVDRETGRIAVRVANYGEVHSGFGPMVKVPRNANLDAAHVGSAELSDGSNVRVAVLPMDTPHAPANLKALHAASWYENSGKAIARGRYSADEHGVRFDGLLFDDLEDAKVDRLTAGSASGDWRSAIALKSFGDFEHAPADFVGSCIVNIGGYSDTYRAAAAERFALVASAAGDFITIEDATMDEDETTTTDATLTAGAADSNLDGPAAKGCEGACTGCACQTGTVTVDNEAAQGAGDVVTITASALAALVDGEGDARDAAADEATKVLIAGGFRHAPDSMEARLERMENELAIEREFNRED